MISLNGEIIRKDFEGEFACKSDDWMHSEYEKRVKVYGKTSHGI